MRYEDTPVMQPPAIAWRVAPAELTWHIVNLVNNGEWDKVCFRFGWRGRPIPFLAEFRPWAWYFDTENGPGMELMWRGENEPYPVSMRLCPDTEEYLEYPSEFEDSSRPQSPDGDEGTGIQFLLPAQYVDVEL